MTDYLSLLILQFNLCPLGQGGQRRRPPWKKRLNCVCVHIFLQNITHPSPADFQDDKDEVVVLEEAVKPDDVGVVETLVNGYFRGHLLPLVLLQDQRLGHDFSGEDLLRFEVCDLVAFGEATFPEESSPGVSSHGAWVNQDVWDFFQRS